MPTFGTLPLDEARANSATGQRAALLQEYMGYIQQVAPGQAGKLEVGEGETTQAVRRRLAAAAETLGKDLEVRRSANTVYFWISYGRPRGGPRRVGEVARNDGPHLQAAPEDATSGYIESSTRQKVRPEVMAHYRASLVKNRRLAELLAQ